MPTPSSTREMQKNECTCSFGDDARTNVGRTPADGKGSSPLGASPPRALDGKSHLDASFVYIPPARNTSTGMTAGDISLQTIPKNGEAGAYNHLHDGYLGATRHISALVGAAEGGLNSEPIDGDVGISLCRSCVERVSRAVDADTERLLAESRAYAEAVTAEEDKQRGIRKALALHAGLAGDAEDTSSRQLSGDQLVCGAISSFEEEVAVLAASCNEHEEEIEYLNDMFSKQMLRASELYEEEVQLYRDINDLEIDAREFENVSHQLSSQCTEAQREVAKLSRVQLHSALFDVTVDKHGLRYPLINELRLAYRPKGDLGWDEISAAWAQAAQLLMFIGGAVKFTSRDLRIVPLTTCAKIIEVGNSGNKKVVHNLGRDMDRSSHVEQKFVSSNKRVSGTMNMALSLCAFNALLYQLLHHIDSSCLVLENGRTPKNGRLPMSRHKIGSHDLLRLQEKDESGWSAVINCMASNLQWLSNNAGHYVPANDFISGISPR